MDPVLGNAPFEIEISEEDLDPLSASDIDYDSSSSGLEATTIQEAVDELADKTMGFTGGNGVSISPEDKLVSVKLSTNANNGLSFDNQGGLLASAGGDTKDFLYHEHITGNFDGETSVTVNLVANGHCAFVSLRVNVRAPKSGTTTLGCVFKGTATAYTHEILPSARFSNGSGQGTVCPFAWSTQKTVGYVPVGIDGSKVFGTQIELTSSAGTGSYEVDIVTIGVPLDRFKQ